MINNETYKHEKKTDRLKNREKVGNITQLIFDIRRQNLRWKLSGTLKNNLVISGQSYIVIACHRPIKKIIILTLSDKVSQVNIGLL